jgi:outer membrane protein TolC
MSSGRGFLAVLTILAAGCAPARAPETPPEAYVFHPPAPTPPRKTEGPLTIGEAVAQAMENAPVLRAARARADAALAGMDLADTAYLPRVDLLWQEIRATRNNISGTTFPNGVIPGISGPVNAHRSWDSAWGSNAGLLIAYEPIDLGLRSANVEVARLIAKQAQADAHVARLEAAAAAAEAFLTLLAAEQTLRAAKANVSRWEVFASTVKTLADKELRPGAEASRAEAEVAGARIQLLGIEQIVQSSRATLAEALGTLDAPSAIEPGPLLLTPPVTRLSSEPANHPLLARQAAAVESVRARERALDDAWVPRVQLLAALNARGSGFGPSGAATDPGDGLWPDRANWAAGVGLYFPLMEGFQIRARRAIEEGLERSERATGDQIYLALKTQATKVRIALETAQKIVENTPLQLKAAQDAYSRSRARYDTGLANVTEVAEAQRLLAQAEIDDALARLSVWRALAAQARVSGDLAPFLKVVGEKK